MSTTERTETSETKPGERNKEKGKAIPGTGY